MGHLNEVVYKSGQKALSEKGVGYMYYYARSEEKAMGSMTFRSSTRTETLNNEGKSFATDTIYLPKHNGTFRTRTASLDLQFKAGVISDVVKAAPMTAKDDQVLNDALALFPGLKIAPGFKPKKSILKVSEKNGQYMDLVYYAIWPVLSSADGRMTFLAQTDTYSFSEPMLVTVGFRNGKEVAGLSFLDRQWATESFGTNIMGDLTGMLKYAQALKYSHAWSAFHLQNKRTKEWSFFHLWNQWNRNPDVRDAKVDYSGMLYMHNGIESGLLAANDYQWLPSGFVQNKGREIMMDYSSGRAGFFPSRADVSSPKLGLEMSFFASPHLQNLNQPIPFYEAYAEGEGTLNGDPVYIRGRLESSRLMFRPQDYDEMIEIMKTKKDGWEQSDLQQWLRDNKNNSADGTPFGWLHERLAVLASLLGEMQLKLAIFGDIVKGTKPHADANDRAVTVYY